MKENSHITIKVSLYEAAMLAKLRKYQYGVFHIHKFDGEPKRIVIEGSETINPANIGDLDDIRTYIKKDV